MSLPARLCVALLLTAAIAPVHALDGKLKDEDGRPVEGARLCLVSENFESYCTNSDAKGHFRLPDAPAPLLRIRALGFRGVEIPVTLFSSPLELKRAAGLLVKVVDAATGEPIGASQVWLRWSDGTVRGPAPANRAGVKLGTLDPGFVRIEVSADGYTQEHLGQAMLVAGKTVETTIRLAPDP